MTAEARRPNYFLIWLWLIGLVLVSIGAGFLLPKGAAIFLIFLAALVKAVLVLLNYMHLKFEGPLLKAMVFVALSTLVIFIGMLFFDTSFQ